MFRHRCTPSERLLALVNELQQGEGTITSGVRCRGLLAASKIRGALNRLQARHPKLRSRIEYDAQQWPSFVEMDPVVPISCEVREVADTSAAEQALLGEWTERFPADASPPVKLLVLHCPDENCTDIVGWFHHSSFYAAAVWTFFQELLEAYADPSALNEPAQGGFEVEPVGPPGVFRDLFWYAKLLWFRIVMGRLYPPVSFKGRPVGEIQYVRDRLSAAWTQRLVAACRREKVSVSAALSAAACMVFARKFSWQGKLIAMPTARDVRADLTPPLDSRTLGCFATSYEVVVPLPDRGEEFWSYARRQTEESLRQFQWKDPIRGLRLIKVVPVKTLVTAGTNRCALVLNNLGRAALPDSPGMPELLDYYGHGRAKSIASTGMTLTAITTNDRMALTLTTGCFTREELRQLLNEIAALLDEACGETQTAPDRRSEPDAPSRLAEKRSKA